MPLGDVLKKEARLVILGEPGAGKTTALQFVTLCFARREQGESEAWHKERLGIETPWIPMLLTLQTRADSIAKRDSLYDVLVSEVRSYLPCSEAEARALLAFWQKSTGLLVLLDGLDEVSSSQSEVREKIARLRGENIRLVVTSRPAGFSPLGDLREYTLKPLDEQEAQGYLTSWLKALKGCSEEEAREEANRLLEKMSAQPALRRLTNNPLLLRLSTERYARTGDIVRNRAELYRDWVNEAWKRAVEKRGAPAEQKETALAALEALAWHRQAGGENTEEACCRALQEYGVAAGPQEAEALLKLLRQKVGLLALDIESKEGCSILHYLFAHQTVCEYFVARRHLRAWEQNARRTFSSLKPHLHLPEWREPLLFLAGLLPDAEIRQFVKWTRCARSPYERQLKRDMLLAAEMATASGRPIPTTLLRALRAAMRHWWTRDAALEALVKIGPQAVPILLKALRDWRFWVCSGAAEALGRIGDPQAVPALIEVARREAWQHSYGNSSTYQAAVQALEKIGTRAIPALLEALQDRDSYVRRAAAQALGSIGAPQALPALLKALGDEDGSVRQAVAKALAKVGPQAVPALIEALQDENTEHRVVVQALGQIGVPQAVPALSEALWDERQEVCQAAVEALGSIGGSQAVLSLCQALQDKQPWMRQAAAKALGQIGDSQAVPALCQALWDESDNVRHAAAEALGEIGDPQAVPALIEALRDEDVRYIAVYALGSIGDPQAVPALLEVLQNGYSAACRWAAAEALGEIGDSRAAPALIGALGDEDSSTVTRKAEEALVKIGPQAVPALLEGLRGWWGRIGVKEVWGRVNDLAARGLGFLAAVWRDRIRLLAKIGPKAIPILIESLRDEDESVRRAAAEALVEIGLPALPALREALGDKDSTVREAAAWALRKIGDPQSVPGLLHALRDEEEWVRWAAAWAIREIGPQAVVPALIAALRHEAWRVRQVAAEALGAIGDPQAVPGLLRALQDEAQEVRQAAAWALWKIGDPQVVPALCEALRDKNWQVPGAAAEALTYMLTTSAPLSPEMEASVQRHLPRLIKTAARQGKYALLGAALQFRAAWQARRSPWQDPFQPTPPEARLRRARPVLVGLALAGALALLGVLVSGAGDVLKARLVPFLQSQPLAWVMVILLLLAALVAGLEALRERWKK